MRLAELERWLWRMGWQPEPNKSGSHRGWQHPAYPGQRLVYGDTHGKGELRPDVVLRILDDLEHMTAVEPVDDAENGAVSA